MCASRMLWKICALEQSLIRNLGNTPNTTHFPHLFWVFRCDRPTNGFNFHLKPIDFFTTGWKQIWWYRLWTKIANNTVDGNYFSLDNKFIWKIYRFNRWMIHFHVNMILIQFITPRRYQRFFFWRRRIFTALAGVTHTQTLYDVAHFSLHFSIFIKIY